MRQKNKAIEMWINNGRETLIKMCEKSLREYARLRSARCATLNKLYIE